jgi:poly(3-hydroxybutyrate) depolymerase
VGDGAKRAVLVSFHGGGYATGSGNGPGYDGAQLALFGDVVVVTVNHRLASFGYTHLADLVRAPEFAHAGVAGIMDLVASLEWVKNNIERFGGDPNRVMIFGQSGGGAKTSAVLATPVGQGTLSPRRGPERFGAALHHARGGDQDGRAIAGQNSKIPKTRIADIFRMVSEGGGGVATIATGRAQTGF